MPPTEQVLDEAVHQAIFTSEGADGTAAAFSDGSVPSCTYSGADIKLLVHLPSEETSYALDQIQGLQMENEELYNEQQSASTPATRRNTLNQGIQANLERMNELMAELSNAQAITKVLSEVQTLSYSIHREKYPVRPLGSVYPKAFCLPESARILTKNRGYLSIKDINSGDYVESSPGNYNKVVAKYSLPHKKCSSIKTKCGYQIDASDEHLFLTSTGWKRTDELKIGDKLLIAGYSAVEENDCDIPDWVIKLTAYLIGDGQIGAYPKPGTNSIGHMLSLSVNSNEIETIGKEVKEILEKENINLKITKDRNSDNLYRFNISVCHGDTGKSHHQNRDYNFLHKFILSSGLYGKKSHNKFIPDFLIANMSKRQTRLFLRRLFATDGCYAISGENNKYIEAQYCSTSEKLIDDVRLLLSRLGINSIKTKEEKVGKTGGQKHIISRHDSYKLVISNCLNLLKFVKRVGIFGKDEKITPFIDLIHSRTRSIDTKWKRPDIRKILKNLDIDSALLTRVSTKFNLWANINATARQVLSVANCVKNEEFTKIVNNHIDELIEQTPKYIYREVISITDGLFLPVYDITVDKEETFVSNFIQLHNCRGPRTISGSMITTVFHRHVFQELIEIMEYRSTGVGAWDRFRWTTGLGDQLPPLDISIKFANEYGNLSWMGLFGVEFVNEGMTMSSEDLFLEGTHTYVARDIDLIRNVANRPLGRNRGVGQVLTGEALLQADLNTRLAKRRNTFI